MLQLVGEAGGRGRGAAGAGEGLDAGGGPGDRFGDERVEAAAGDGEGVSVGAAGAGGFVERGVSGRWGCAAAGDVFDERLNLPKLRELRGGGGPLVGFEGGRLVGHRAGTLAGRG